MQLLYLNLLLQNQYNIWLWWAERTLHRTDFSPRLSCLVWSPWSCRHRPWRRRRRLSSQSVWTPWHTCPWSGWRRAPCTLPCTWPESLTALRSWGGLKISALQTSPGDQVRVMFTCYNVPFKSVEEKEGSFHLPIEVVMVFIDLQLVLVTSAGLNLFSGPHVETQGKSETRNSLGF